MNEQDVFDEQEYREPVVVSTKEETDRKCPQCGGVMDFDPATGGLKCPYCDYVQQIAKKEDAPETAQELFSKKRA